MKIGLSLAVVAMIGLSTGNAWSLTFSIGGTHDRAEVKSICAHAGGSFSAGAGGCDCIYPNGAGLTCDKKGTCTGYTTREGGPASSPNLAAAVSRLTSLPGKSALGSAQGDGRAVSTRSPLAAPASGPVMAGASLNSTKPLGGPNMLGDSHALGSSPALGSSSPGLASKAGALQKSH